MSQINSSATSRPRNAAAAAAAAAAAEDEQEKDPAVIEAKRVMREKLLDVKQRIVRLYGGRLLGPTVADQTPLEVIRRSDSDEEKRRKQQINKEILQRRATEQQQREPELIAELDRVIGRIRNARFDYRVEDFSGSIYGSSQAVLPTDSYTCTQCGNSNPDHFVQDDLKGDTVCMGADGAGCGAVVQDHSVYQGAEKRNFEGEEDRNHFGPAANKLMPDSVNMETNLFLRPNHKDNKNFRRLSYAQKIVEMNLSSLGRDDKHTREGYKTNQKRQAFGKIEEIASNVNLHHLVVQKAKEEFTKYRDARDALHQLDGVMCGCLVIAYTELAEQNLLQFETSATIHKVIQDIGVLPNSDFGVASDRSAVRDDAAIHAVPSLPMGRFSLENVKEWLFAVASFDGAQLEEEALLVYEHISNLMQQEQQQAQQQQQQELSSMLSTVGALPVKKTAAAPAAVGFGKAIARRYPTEQSTMFGSTTASSRFNKYKKQARSHTVTSIGSQSTDSATVATTAAARARQLSVGSEASNGTKETSSSGLVATSAGQMTAGQQLLRLNMTDVFSEADDSLAASEMSPAANVEAEKLFKEAVIRRSKYDSWLFETERLKTLETTRLKVAESTQDSKANLMKRKLQHSTIDPGSSSSAAADAAVINESTKRMRVESGTKESKQADSTSSATETGKEAVFIDMDASDFDLEEFVGGPVKMIEQSAVVSELPTDEKVIDNGSTSSSGSSSSVDMKNGVGATMQHSIAASGDSMKSGKPLNQKIGMKPKRKIVISS